MVKQCHVRPRCLEFSFHGQAMPCTLRVIVDKNLSFWSLKDFIHPMLLMQVPQQMKLKQIAWSSECFILFYFND